MPNITFATDSQATALQKEIERRISLFQERDRVMHNIRRYRLMRHSVNLPKAYQRSLGGENAAKLPLMLRLVQTAVGSVMKRAPGVRIEPLSASDKAAAEYLSKGASLLLQAVERQSKKHWLYDLSFNMFGDGLAVVKSLPGPWSGYPIPKEGESDKEYNERVNAYKETVPLPFYSRIVNPLTFYPPQEEYGNGVAIESAWRSTTEVCHKLGLKQVANGNFVPMSTDMVPTGLPVPTDEPLPGMAGTIRVTELWTDNECAIILGDQHKVLLFENPMGELPYVWGYGDPTGVEDPTNEGMSVAYPLYYLAPHIDRLVGMMLAWSSFAAPTPYTTQDPVPGVKPTVESAVETYRPGMMHHFATGRKPGVLQAPDVGKQVTQFLSFLVESADRGGLPALVSGAGVGTRLPALTFQAAFEAATDRLRPAVQSLERVLEGSIHKWLNIIGRYDTTIKVNGWLYTTDGNQDTRGWATIKAVEARKGRQVVVTVPVDSTQDLIAKGTHAQFMVAANLWDMERAMRYAGVENPEETRNKIAADTAWRAALQPLALAIMQQSPELAQAMAEEAQAEEGTGGIIEGLGEAPGPGRNRPGVPAGRGGGRRGTPTQRPRGNRQGGGRTFGRT